MESKSRERQQFEAWAKSEGFSVARGIPKHCVNTIYTDGETYSLWQAWQASRSALVVELPESFEVEMGAYGGAKVVSVVEVTESLRAAGITVKGDS